MKKVFLITIISIIGIASSLVVYAISWPANLTRHNDIVLTPSSYQPSGLAWNSVTNKLFTVCNTGQVTIMNFDGTSQQTTAMPYYMDFEAITIVDQNSTKVYIGNENPDSILEYDWQTKTLTGKSWNLTSIMTGADNQGLEGLTFVPNSFHPFPNSASGGVFYAGIQRTPVSGGDIIDDYLIYVFDIDLNTSGKIIKWWGIPVAPNTPTYDIADMYFNQDTGILYVLYDGANRLIEMKTDGTVIKDYSNVSVNEQEGLVIKTSYPSLTADIYLASDTDKSIGWYSGYPVDYDFDKDGSATSIDCNDKDKNVSVNQVYYQDLDGDKLGFGVGKQFCLSVPPTGYVSNVSDLNDNDFDNDNVITTLDCNDKDKTVWEKKIYYKDNDDDTYGNGISESICSLTTPVGYVVSSVIDCNDNDKNVFVNQTYYQDMDGDKLGSDIFQTVCSLTVPVGYVSNSNDNNDNDFDNDGASTTNDCNDKDNTIFQPKRYFLDSDRDGLGSTVFQIVCSLTPPLNYVVNSNDINDNDHDNDGVITYYDCNDSNNTVFGKENFYKDLDGDGLGFGTAVVSCLAPTAQYVKNNNDLNDNDFDNDGVIIVNDCNDKNNSILGKQKYYRDFDLDGLGSSTITILSCTLPKGYVTNSNDINDNDYDNDSVETNFDCNDKNKSVLGPKLYYQDFDQDG
ncbi:MAG: SdiA-regulated domain-containing protein, partial [Candidatus Magasanikiibacteriota bacterium]